MEIKVTFPDVPGAAIVGNEDGVTALIAKLTAGMDAAQLARMMLKAEYNENAESLAGDPARKVDAIAEALQQWVREWNGAPPKGIYIDNGQ